MIGSTVSTAIMSAVLDHFAREAGLGPNGRAVVVLDGAGWHTGHDLKVPDGVHLAFLPPYSPELQPAERIWPIINEVVANRTYDDLLQLLDAVGARCRHLDTVRDHIRAVTKYHWWPDEHRCAV